MVTCHILVISGWRVRRNLSLYGGSLLPETRRESLRHSLATALVDREPGNVTISKLLGHANVKATMTYAKMQPNVMQSAIEKLVTMPSYGYKIVTNWGGEEEG